MGKLQEELCYIKGLIDGMDFKPEERAGLIIKKMANFLEEVVSSLEAVENNCQNLRNYIESVDKDLGDLETKIYPQKEVIDISGSQLKEAKR